MDPLKPGIVPLTKTGIEPLTEAVDSLIALEKVTVPVGADDASALMVADGVSEGSVESVVIVDVGSTGLWTTVAGTR